jgi:hypothetical protein
MKPHVHWLSQEKVLTRFFELRTKIELFLREKFHCYSTIFKI